MDKMEARHREWIVENMADRAVAVKMNLIRFWEDLVQFWEAGRVERSGANW